MSADRVPLLGCPYCGFERVAPIVLGPGRRLRFPARYSTRLVAEQAWCCMTCLRVFGESELRTGQRNKAGRRDQTEAGSGQ